MKLSKNLLTVARAKTSAQFQNVLLTVFSILVMGSSAISAHAQIQYKTAQPKGSQVKLHRHQAAPIRNDRPQTAKEKADQARNVLYVHPPKVTAAIKPAARPTHAPPAPYAHPKIAPAAIVNRGALPKGVHNKAEHEEKDEDTENLIRNWNNRRPMSEEKKAVHHARFRA